MKRLIDILISLPAIILLSPVFLFTIVAIKITSKGPVIFKQQRAGK
ncbi:MAG: sugar transferase, partial [Planctomycetota bacterium]